MSPVFDPDAEKNKRAFGEAARKEFVGEPKLSELYQEVILDHNKSPKNFEKLGTANHYAHGVNPLCGDDYEIYLEMTPDGTVKRATFQGHGCAISKASASMMTVAVEGKKKAEVETLEKNFIHLLTDATVSDTVRAGAGRLKFFEGVKQFPIRVKCATLAWRALEEALKGSQQKVTTEE